MDRRRSGGRLAEFALNRQPEPGEVLLHHVVVRAGAHDLDRRFLTDAPRDDDEWHVNPARLHQLQGGRSTELRQTEVANDQVGQSFVEGGTHLTCGHHPTCHQIRSQLFSARTR